MNIIDHLERYLGPISEGWSDDETGGIQAVRFADRPEPGVSTYATIGLSRILLPTPESGVVTQELSITAYDAFSSRSVASFLVGFAEFIISKNRGLERGDLVGPSSPIVPGVAATALYAAIPALHGEGFASFESDTGPIDIVWLLPMPLPEAAWAKQHGWRAYESMLLESEVDFFDLNRPPVCTAT